MSEAKVLIVAQHTVIGALLGSLLELAGHRALFPLSDEAPDAALSRTEPRLTLLDSDHPLSNDQRLFDAARVIGCPLLMFSSSLSSYETQSVAEERHLKSFTLPIKYRDFVQLIDRTLPPFRLDGPSGEHRASASL